MKLTLYHLKNCDQCRKAIKALKSAGHDLTLIDVRADGISAQTLTHIVKTVGWEILLNRRSATWRALAETEKTDLTESKALHLMQAHPTLIKRPLIYRGEIQNIGSAQDPASYYVGFGPDVQKALLD